MRFFWIPFGLQINKFLHKILPENMIIPILQGKLKGKKWFIRSSNIEFVLGTYEYELGAILEKEIKPNLVFYDIGAHVGYYTLLAATLVNNNGNVFAFEPVPRNINYIKKHLKMNNINNVQVISAAVSNSCGKTLFNISCHDSTGYISKNLGNNTIEINLVNIDQLVDEKEILPPNYIKIDVEGSELSVLKGASSTLDKYKPMIFLEAHNKILLDSCCDYLISKGYNIKLINMEGRTTYQIHAY